MLSTFEWLYFGGGTLLFFFWVYGIFAFVRDCRRTYIPGLLGLLAARGESNANREGEETEEDREDRKRQLY